MDLLLNYVWGALSKKETMKANKMNFIHLIRQFSSKIEYCILCREDITFLILIPSQRLESTGVGQKFSQEAPGQLGSVIQGGLRLASEQVN